MKTEVAIVHACVILLGTNSLISLTGLWVELPLMIPHLPEGWQLPSYVNIIYQVANIAPILYALFQWLFPKHVTETRVCFGMLAIGAAASFLMALYWRETAFVFGARRSIALFVLTFFLSMVDSLSSLVCFPFMASLKPKYMMSYMIGEGLSGFLPSMFSLAQAVTESGAQCLAALPNSTSDVNVTLAGAIPVNATLADSGYVDDTLAISVDTFFYILFVMLLLSSAGFVMLIFHPIVKSQRVPVPGCEEKADLALKTLSAPPAPGSEKLGLDPVPAGCEGHQNGTLKMEEAASGGEPGESKSDLYKLILSKVYVAVVVYGVAGSIQSYSCLPYGNLAYNLSTVLACISYPVMAVVYIVYPIRNRMFQYVMILAGTLVGGYLLMTAIMSPNPPMKDSLAGQIIVVAAWALFSCIFAYTYVATSCILRDIGHNALYWTGVWTQAGCSIGSIMMFVLVAVFNVFQDEKC